MFFNIVHESFWCLNWGWFPSFGLGGIIHGGFCWDDETNVTSPSVNRGFYGENFLGNCYFETWWSNDLQQKTDIRQFFKTRQQNPFRVLSLGSTSSNQQIRSKRLKTWQIQCQLDVSWMLSSFPFHWIQFDKVLVEGVFDAQLAKMLQTLKCHPTTNGWRMTIAALFSGMKKGPAAYPVVFLNEVCQHDFFGRMTLANGIYTWQLYEHNGP